MDAVVGVELWSAGRRLGTAFGLQGHAKHTHSENSRALDGQHLALY